MNPPDGPTPPNEVQPPSLADSSIESIPAPDPTPTQAPSAWVIHDDVRQAPRPPTRLTRAIEALAWVVGLLAIIFFGRLYALFNSSVAPSAYELGRTTGTIAAAIIVGVAIRWVWVRARGGRLRSPWILLIAVAVLLAGLGRDSTGGSDIVGRPIGTYLQIEAPLSLASATAEEQEQFKAAMGEEFGTYEVRRVIEAGEFVGFFVVGDANVGSSPDWDALERGFESSSGIAAQQTLVGNRSALVGKTPDSASVVWIESPYLLTIVAVDEVSARYLAEAVMTGYGAAGPSP